MPFTLTENWDGVTAPTIPAGWNVDPDFGTSTTNQYSSPNSLWLNNLIPDTVFYATNSGVDTGGGATIDFTSLVYVDTSAGTGDYFAGPTFRCSSATMDNSTTSAYWVRLWFNPAYAGAGGGTLRFSSIVNGTVTDLYTVYSGINEVQPGHWFSIRVTSYGSNVFNVVVTRMTDGYTMDLSGNFVATASTAIQSYNATAIASGDYSGLAAASFDSGKVYLDDVNVNTSGVVVVPPNKPVIARIPFQYYITD